MRDLSLYQVRSVIQNTCRAIDVRAIAVNADSGRKSAISIIRPTYRSSDKVNQDHEALLARSEAGG